MTNPSRTLVFLLSMVALGSILSGCGNSGGGEMSDEEKIKTMQKAHDVPLGSPGGSGAPNASTAGAAPSSTGQ